MILGAPNYRHMPSPMRSVHVRAARVAAAAAAAAAGVASLTLPSGKATAAASASAVAIATINRLARAGAPSDPRRPGRDGLRP